KFSGGLFVPPSPYFVGFFLCNRGRRDVVLTGRSYVKQGRYICVDGPPPGKEITTVIALDKEFSRGFGSSKVPVISGFAIEADTTQVGQGDPSSAWVKSIKIAPSN